MAPIVVLLLAMPLLGQEKETQMWGGLKLGMTVAEVRKALPYRTRISGKRDQIPGKSVPGVMKLRIPKVLLGTLPVTAAIYFGEEGDLTGALLISDHDNRNYCDTPGNLEKKAADLLWETFMAELQKQDGEPSSFRTVEGENGSTVNTKLAVWNGALEHPEIDLLLTGSCKEIDVAVTYAPPGFRKH
jgi:hypothetical protein